MSHRVLLEIGMEECPARFMPPAMQQIERLIAEQFRAARISFETVRSMGTPRRLTVWVDGVAEKQEDLAEEVKGPPKQAAFDAEGRPTKAAEGFARKQGLSVDELEVRETEQGSYVYARKSEPGRPTQEVLAEVLPSVIQRLSFPKSMRWGAGNTRFIRPIRWIVALFDEAIIPFEYAGVRSGRESKGHRFLSEGPVVIPDPDGYVDALRSAGVIVDPEERRDMIANQLVQCADEVNAEVWEDSELLDEVTFLVEHPTALLGSFDPSYLDLPVEVLVTTMKKHQRYFPLLDKLGNPVAQFIAVRDGDTRALDQVRAGNEKVLAARLADARFFFEEDQKVPLADRIEQLDDVLFQEALGSMRDKVDRIVRLTEFLGENLQVDSNELQRALRAAELCKADLVTQMVYEFPELQGIMGREYALADGEDELVAQAIDEHYAPRFSGDALPESAAGSLVSLADRLDTLAGCFAVGLMPSGSQDPYALRRHALGMLHILLEHQWTLSLPAALDHALNGLADRVQFGPELKELLLEFIAARLRGILLDQGFRADHVDAVLARGLNDVPDVVKRLNALKELDAAGALSVVIRIHERTANLAGKAERSAVQEELFAEPAEESLWKALQQTEQHFEDRIAQRDYVAAMQAVQELAPEVDAFFDAVMVMVEDQATRQNRLSLLKRISNLTGYLADLRLVIEA